MILKRSLFLFLALFFIFLTTINAQTVAIKTVKPTVVEKLKNTYTSTNTVFDTIMKKAGPIIEKSQSRLKIFAPALEKIKQPAQSNMTIEVNNVIMNFDKAELINQNCVSALSFDKKMTEKTSKLKTEETNTIKLIQEVYKIDQSLSTLTSSAVEGDFEKMQEWLRLPEVLDERIVLMNSEISSFKAELELNATSEEEVNSSIKTRKIENKDFLIYEQKQILLNLKKEFLNQCIQHNTVLIEIFKEAIENSKKSVSVIQNSKFYKNELFDHEKSKKLLLEKKLIVDKQKMQDEKNELEKESKKAQQALIKFKIRIQA